MKFALSARRSPASIAGTSDWRSVRRPFVERPRTIQVDRVVKEYHTAIGMRRILDGISFTIAHGEKIAVLGKNGAGKSTLVRLFGRRRTAYEWQHQMRTIDVLAYCICRRLRVQHERN